MKIKTSIKAGANSSGATPMQSFGTLKPGGPF